jgi:hypothetical protein
VSIAQINTRPMLKTVHTHAIHKWMSIAVAADCILLSLALLTLSLLPLTLRRTSPGKLPHHQRGGMWKRQCEQASLPNTHSLYWLRCTVARKGNSAAGLTLLLLTFEERTIGLRCAMPADVGRSASLFSCWWRPAGAQGDC